MLSSVTFVYFVTTNTRKTFRLHFYLLISVLRLQHGRAKNGFVKSGTANFGRNIPSEKSRPGMMMMMTRTRTRTRTRMIIIIIIIITLLKSQIILAEQECSPNRSFSPSRNKKINRK